MIVTYFHTFAQWHALSCSFFTTIEGFCANIGADRVVLTWKTLLHNWFCWPPFRAITYAKKTQFSKGISWRSFVEKNRRNLCFAKRWSRRSTFLALFNFTSNALFYLLLLFTFLTVTYNTNIKSPKHCICC